MGDDRRPALGEAPLDAAAYVDALAETGLAMVSLLDRDGRIVLFDEGCEHATGWRSGDVLGRDAREVVIPPEEHEAFDRFLESVWETRASSPQVGHWLTADGERRLIAWSNRPVLGRDGEVEHLLSVGLDLTERDRAHAELRELHEELARRAQELAELAGEQSALRRVAVLVAGEASPALVFEAVSVEVARLLGGDTAAVLRFDNEQVGTFVGRWNERGELGYPAGSRIDLCVDSVVGRVLRTRAPSRIDHYEDVAGDVSAEMRQHGFHCSAAVPVVVAGRLWGAIVVASQEDGRLPEGTTEQRLAAFAELVALALASADARDQLLASRARLVQVADEERRRLERDLHDGAQQRLVALAQRLQLALRFLDRDPAAAREQLEISSAETRSAIEDLRLLARGLHPPLLTEAGLAAALRSMAERFHLPVRFAALAEERAPAAVETAAYYLVSEALTNAGKHAQATSVTVAVRRSPSSLEVEVSDDGVGGAAPVTGGGLHGLTDRVEALGGSLSLTSVPNRGTTLRAELPLA